MYNLKKFNSHSEYTSFTGTSEFIKPNVSYCVEEDDVHYTQIPRDYSQDYLTFDIISGGTIKFTSSNTGFTRTIYHSEDDGHRWFSLTSSTGGTAFDVSAGDKVLFTGPNSTYGEGNTLFVSFKGSTAVFNIYGNIMSLIDNTFMYGEDLTLQSAYTFYLLFQETNVINAENLILPATGLTNNCYAYMFRRCALLEKAPVLPAMTLANNCYQGMFNSCESLTSAPVLPAMTLANNCYQGMFNGCTSLTSAPVLPAPTLTNYCYATMFGFCSNLSSITCLATDISASNCTQNWVNGVASSGTFTKAASMASWTTGVGGIPEGWTVQNAS